MRVAILGCGPTGLIAANEAVRMGMNVAIFSKPRKSFMRGAQYLHEPVHGLDQEPFKINYVLEGRAEAYRMKVYGRQWDGRVSPEDLVGEHDGYDIREAYDQLWDTFEKHVTPWEATPSGLRTLVELNRPDVVISTIPAPLLCTQGHSFRSTRIWSSSQAFMGSAYPPDNTVLCNGNMSPRWYRVSRIQGWVNTEWPDGVKPPIGDVVEVQKPTDNNCDCFPGIIRAGRYGKWKKGVLSHEIQSEMSPGALDRAAQEMTWL